jgi:hypothetical protein
MCHLALSGDSFICGVKDFRYHYTRPMGDKNLLNQKQELQNIRSLFQCNQKNVLF